jgi:DNA-binding response OmpR family regulator
MTDRILIADDDAAIRRLLAALSRRAGFEVDVATNGAAALALMAEHRYSVVLLDLMMPNVSGYDVIRELKKRAIRPPIIVVTAMAGELLSPVDPSVVLSIVRKPFDMETLILLLRATATTFRELHPVVPSSEARLPLN